MHHLVPVMVCLFTLHILSKSHLYFWRLNLFLNLSDWPPTHLGHRPISSSLSQTLICFLFSFFTWYSRSPCLYFDPWLLILTSVTYSQFRTPSLTSYIVADMMGTPQFDLWGLPLCQYVTSVRLAFVLEYLYIQVASSQCCPYNSLILSSSTLIWPTLIVSHY